MKRIRCRLGFHRFGYASDKSCERSCTSCREREQLPIEHAWSPWSAFDGHLPQVRKCQRCERIARGGPDWDREPKDPRGRLIIGESPFRPLQPCSQPGESSWRSIKQESITVVAETDEYRRVHISMTVADGYGVINYDPGGSWGGGGEGQPYEVEYTAIDLREERATRG